jgi:hypothetical protein
MEGERRRTTGLEATARALASWRRKFGGPGRRIPDELWADAGEAARSNGIAKTARVLRLDVRKLSVVAKEVAASAPTESVAPTTFVELGGLDIGAQNESVQIEYVGRDGDRIRVHVPSGARSAVDVVELVRAFRSRSS